MPDDRSPDRPPPRPSLNDASELTRRSALRLGLAGGLSALAAAYLPGCVGTVPAVYETTGTGAVPAATPSRYADAPTRRAQVTHVAPRAPAAEPVPARIPAAMSVTPRSAWTRAGTGRNVKPMNGVDRITVHHSAMPIRSTAAAATAGMLTSIREGHLGRGWADIGYHFAIDRGGRILACRDLGWQGAHVAEHNEHNIGVCVLGNFDEQRPSTAQINALHAALTHLAVTHRVPMRRVFTHRELNPTACPGASLQRHMVLARQGRA